MATVWTTSSACWKQVFAIGRHRHHNPLSAGLYLVLLMLSGFHLLATVPKFGLSQQNETTQTPGSFPAFCPGDSCASAIPLSGSSGSYTYSTTNCTHDYSGSCGGTGPDKVFRLWLNAGDTLRYWISSNNYDVLTYVRVGSCTGAEVVCHDDPDNAVITWVNTTNTSQYVYIFVDGFANSSGSGTLNWQISSSASACPGDVCADFVPLSGTSGTYSYSTTSCNHDYSGSCGGAGPDRVFRLLVPSGYTLTYWVTNDNYDVLTYLRVGNCSTGTEVACHDDPDTATVSWTNNTGSDQYVFLFIDGFGSSSGSGVLNWRITPPGGNACPGDACSDYVDLAAYSSGSYDYTTTSCTHDYTGGCGGVGPDRVFRLYVPRGDTLRYWITNDDYDVLTYVRVGSCTGTEVVCHDDPDNAVVTWVNTTNLDLFVYLIIDGYGTTNGSGSGTLNWRITSGVWTSTPSLAQPSSSQPIYIWQHNNQLYVKADAAQTQTRYYTLQMYTLAGVRVHQWQLTLRPGEITILNLKGLSAGAYIARVHTEEGEQVLAEPIIIE